jgi:hypothetical protein
VCKRLRVNDHRRGVGIKNGFFFDPSAARCECEGKSQARAEKDEPTGIGHFAASTEALSQSHNPNFSSMPHSQTSVTEAAVMTQPMKLAAWGESTLE